MTDSQVFLDANAILYAFDETSPRFVETVAELSRQDITKLVTDFLGFSNVVHNPYFLLNAIRLYDLHPSLSIVDCYASAEAEAYNNKLATFDKRLAVQGGKHVNGL